MKHSECVFELQDDFCVILYNKAPYQYFKYKIYIQLWISHFLKNRTHVTQHEYLSQFKILH